LVVLLVVDHVHAQLGGVVEHATGAVVAVAGDDRERVLRGDDRQCGRTLVLRQGLEVLEQRPRVLRLLVRPRGDQQLAVGVQLRADEAGVPQDLFRPLGERHDRAADRGGVRGQQQVGLVVVDEALEQLLGGGGVALVVVDAQLHLAPEQAALGLDLLDPQVVRGLVGGRRTGVRAGQPEGAADDDGFVGAGRRAFVVVGASGQYERGRRCDGADRPDRGSHESSPAVGFLATLGLPAAVGVSVQLASGSCTYPASSRLAAPPQHHTTTAGSVAEVFHSPWLSSARTKITSPARMRTSTSPTRASASPWTRYSTSSAWGWRWISWRPPGGMVVIPKTVRCDPTLWRVTIHWTAMSTQPCDASSAASGLTSATRILRGW